MSNKRIDEPVFPRTYSHDGHNGMWLRDYFAAKAMQGMLGERWPGSNDQVEIAKRAYALADAMLEARLA